MLSILHSYYKTALLLTLVFLGLSFGHFVSSILQVRMLPAPGVAVLPKQPLPTTEIKTSEASLNKILQNNIFDADNRLPGARIGQKPVNALNGQGKSKPRSVPLKLIGTVVAKGRSLALLEAQRELQLYSPGDEVPGGGTIEDIDRNQVTVRHPDRSVSVLLLRDEGTSFVASKREGSAKKGKFDAVKLAGENHWRVSKKMVDSARENFAAQLRLAQMQPRLVDGKTDGFQVQRISPQSMLAKMGIRRGDVVINVNDLKLDSPERALQVFQQLREAQRVSVGVERNGQPMNFVYEIE